ncbi:hypothetical protein [Nitrobacter sp. TKz-YC02]|uniref:hypothetical protein n=1 Tax=Nitrobacter sp. TKz-YC02 TaxID=3398704 RepID=UPI003CF5A845
MAKKKKPTAPEQESDLVMKRELFCQYITQNSSTFGNGTLSYGLAYGYKLDELSREPEYEGEGKKLKKLPSEYDRACAVCATEAARLLRIPEVIARVRVLLNELLKDNVVDARLAEHIMQVDDGELSLSGIKEYNKLRGRIIDKTRDVTERFAMDDIRELLAPLPQERRDEIYAILTTAIAEAELLRSAAQGQDGHTR